MIITTIQELRLASPAHALDSIDGLVGFIDNSEHDFLEDKLGTPLYNALCQWYDENPSTRTSVSDYQTGYWNRLLLLAQRCVAFDALGRAIGMQAISVNNAGINMSIADDYPKADDKAMQTYRDTCTKEAHAALNQLLRQLEQWCKEQGTATADDTSSIIPQPSDIEDGTSSISPQPSDIEDDTSSISPQPSAIEDSERSEIVTLWRQSRYYYLAAALLIPSCEVLQSYLNIYDSREKFIQLLPDLQFIQEEQITPAVGDDLMAALIAFATDGTLPDAETPESLTPLFNTVLHRLRKVMAALLAGRTSVLKYTKEQKIQYHDDGVRMFETAINYLRAHQSDFPEELVKNAPWYVPQEAPAPAPAQPEQSPCGKKPSTLNSQLSTKEDPALWTPPLL